jgi:hypothetical protein
MKEPFCLDCGRNTHELHEAYMLKNSVWPLHFHAGVLCIACLERRLDRQVTRADFNMKVWLNTSPNVLRSELLQSRMAK